MAKYKSGGISKIKLAAILFMVLFLPLAVYAVNVKTNTQSDAAADCYHKDPILSYRSITDNKNSVIYYMTIKNTYPKPCWSVYGLSITDKPAGDWKFTFTTPPGKDFPAPELTEYVDAQKSYNFRVEARPPANAKNGTYEFNLKACQSFAVDEFGHSETVPHNCDSYKLKYKKT